VFGFVRNKEGKIFDESHKEQMKDGSIKDDDTASNLSDNVSAAGGSECSFFDPPIEYYRANNAMGMDSYSRDISGD